MNIKTFYYLFLILTFPCFCLAGVNDWTTFTNQGHVRDIIFVDNYIWCATNGGVFRYDPTNDSYLQFYNTNGLTSLDAQAIEVDNDGKIWVGFADGWLNIYDSNSWTAINDYLGHTIYDLKSIGDSLLVALDIGISLYDIGQSEVKETYKNLGNHIPIEIPVKNISINGREIWASTEYGIARSSFNLANLMAPESWTNYTMSSGLPSNEINTVVAYHDSFFAATDNGAAVFADGVWNAVNDNLVPAETIDFVSNGLNLFALTVSNINQWNSQQKRWEKIGENLAGLSCFKITQDNNFWVGRKKSETSMGIASLTSEQKQWQEFCPTGPPGNEITCLAVDQKGILWCGSLKDGIFSYDEHEPVTNKQWQQYYKSYGLISGRIASVTIDSQNRKWFGTTGGGVVKIEDQDSLVNVSIIYNEILSGISGYPNFVVITDIKVDRFDNIWMLNLEASNHQVVAVRTPQDEWQFFTTQEGILNNAVRAVAFDQYDRAWIGSDGGVNVIDYKGTLINKADDDLSGTLTTLDGLGTNHIKDIDIDIDNITWIATESGLYSWRNGNLYSQYGVISNSTNCVQVDIRNNKWIGTSAGVSMLAPDGITFQHYSTDSSPIVSNNITSFGFDPETGKVYIGTTNGISCLETRYAKPRDDLSMVKVGPNPFIINRDRQFHIYELPDDMAIKIMAENGSLVRQIAKEDFLGNQADWDGKNKNGDFVASGVYLIVIYNNDTGENTVTKVAVIR